MEKNKVLNVILLGVVLPIVVTVISTIIIDKIKARNQAAQLKSASQSAPKVTVTTGESEVSTQTTI